MNYIKNNRIVLWVISGMSVLILLHNRSYPAIHAQHDGFTFEINGNEIDEISPEVTIFSDDENIYDAVCDRLPSQKMAWWKRMISQAYIFWYSKSQYWGNYVAEYGKKIKRHVKKCFLLVRGLVRVIKK